MREIAKVTNSLPAAREYGAALTDIIARATLPGGAIRDMVRSYEIKNAGGLVIHEADGPRLIELATDNQYRRYLIAAEVAKIARAAGARHAVPNDVMRRAVKYYAFLSLDEVGAAFDLAAAGKIETDLTLYGGAFNVVYLSDILKAYKRYRGEVRREIERKRDEDEKQRRRDANAARLADLAYKSNLERLAAALDEMKEGGTPNVLSYQYDILDNAGRLDFTNEQKRAAMRQADKVLKAEINGEKANENDVFKRIALETTIANLGTSGAIISRAKVILLVELLASYAATGKGGEHLKRDLLK
jgi:hypothetical protein